MLHPLAREMSDNAYTAMREGVTVDCENDAEVTHTEADEPQHKLTRGTSSILEARNEFVDLKTRAVTDCPQYAAIVESATIPEDVPCDCWGAMIFIIVHDFPDLRAGRAVWEAKIRVAFTLVVFVINLGIQGILLFFISKLLMMPSMLSVQNIYRTFHEKAFEDGVFGPDQFEAMDFVEKNHLCGLALSQGLFVRVILFLWVTTNVGEFRENYTHMMGSCNLPRLPDGLDTRLFIRDIPETESVEYSVICLNTAGKVSLLILVFIPKFLIAIILTLAGCLWLMAAENVGDLILNSLALAFVCKVDELIAAVFFPRTFQENLVHLEFSHPPHEDEDDEEKRMNKRGYEFVMCFITLFLTLGMVETMIVFQPVMPNYSNDVAGACWGYINSQLPWCMPWQKNCFPM